MAGRFVFRLASVLRHREWIEDEKKQKLAEANRALLAAEEARQALRDRRETLARELTSEHAKLDGETLRISYAHMEFLAREITAADMTVAGCFHAVNLSRDALVQATKNRKVLDRLRERQFKVYEAEQMRLEQRDLDDANARQYGRKLREGTTQL